MIVEGTAVLDVECGGMVAFAMFRSSSISGVDAVGGLDDSFGPGVSRSCGRTRTFSGLVSLAHCCAVGFNAKVPNFRFQTWLAAASQSAGDLAPTFLLNAFTTRNQ